MTTLYDIINEKDLNFSEIDHLKQEEVDAISTDLVTSLKEELGETEYNKFEQYLIDNKDKKKLIGIMEGVQYDLFFSSKISLYLRDDPEADLQPSEVLKHCYLMMKGTYDLLSKHDFDLKQTYLNAE